MAAARYAALFADHVAQDMAAEGGPGAYVRIWLCARRAFIDSMSAGSPADPLEPGAASWENEGGSRSVAAPPGRRSAADDARRDGMSPQ
jgi:hypothetical protein